MAANNKNNQRKLFKFLFYDLMFANGLDLDSVKISILRAYIIISVRIMRESFGDQSIDFQPFFEEIIEEMFIYALKSNGSKKDIKNYAENEIKMIVQNLDNCGLQFLINKELKKVCEIIDETYLY